MLSRILIANRGEIAVRIIRACRDLGISSVAVFSDADRFAPHVLAADESVRIGPSPASESYLVPDAIIDAARRTNADAVHPGYGFLAENAAFAARVIEEGLVFIGPPPGAIAAMGDKTAARARMIDAGVPVVPGSAALEDAAHAESEAAALGYPVMLKAAAGGGGKGMRVVEGADGIAASFRAAQNEAKQAFGDDRVYLERYLSGPRHIEIQILADRHGEVIYLPERECSIQRRHQKLIEESPSPVLTRALREEMGQVAVAAARAVDYVGAGTVEFMFQDGEFFFLEMNTRIQVEHPVTELVTGVDLVQAQIRIAAGENLAIEPDPDWPRGHAIECRISGEDPFDGFLPSTGTIRSLRIPSGPGVRWDGGIRPGFEVGLHYDPLLAKLIVHAETRELALSRLRGALRELEIGGIRTTQPFHMAVIDEPDFRAGDMTIHYVDQHPELLTDGYASWQARTAAVAATLLENADRGRTKAAAGGKGREASAARSEWQRAFSPE